MPRDYNEINKNIALTGFFSEYLPPCFYLDDKILRIIPTQEFDKVSPLTFTMSRYTKYQGRRTISIPEICSYLVIYNYIKEQSIIEELVEFTEAQSFSFSPILAEDGTIIRHEQIYKNDYIEIEVKTDNYMNNLSRKIIQAAACKTILSLDVANCFGSFYMHMIPAILLGADSAQNEFLLSINRVGGPSNSYLKYSKLDKLMRGMNLDRTNGLLVGPLYSKILVEALFTRIDMELKELGFSFSRYVDDYEVYIYDDEHDKIMNHFTTVLRKYGFSLNTEKTELKKFPYYSSENLSRTFKNKMKFMREAYSDGDEVEYNEFTIDLFNTFFLLEEQSVKGAVRYCLKSFARCFNEEEFIDFACDSDLFTSYLLSILQNEPRSLINVWQLLLSKSPLISFTEMVVNRLYLIAIDHAQKENDLETIWLVYLLIEHATSDVQNRNLPLLLEIILESNNELAQIMVYNKGLLNIDQIQRLKSKATSWLLLYELYKKEDIVEEFLRDKLKLNKNLQYYQRLKRNNISFCNFNQ